MLQGLFHNLSAFSILLPTIVSIIRFRSINIVFRPFVYLLWVGSFVELLTYVVGSIFKNSLMIGNVYVLIESIMLLWQFYAWNKYRSYRNKCLVFGIIFLVFWVVDNLVINDITRINSLFRVIYSFTIVLFSINQVNVVFSSERKNVLHNPAFLICMGLIFFFAFKAIFETIYVIGVKMSLDFYNTLMLLLTIVNLFVNIIYTIATLWIPKKLRFSLPLQ
jgi:hypothetical protein